MRVFLDTKDLISVLERGEPCDVNALGRSLVNGSHRLCISVANVRELAAPLVEGDSSGPSVTKTLADLEKLPLTYLREHKVIPLEIIAAMSAYSGGEEPATVTPYSDRFDKAIEEMIPTRLFLNYPLPEIVFDLWQDPSIFRKRLDHESRLRNVLDADRGLGRLPKKKVRFRDTIRRHADSCGISLAQDLNRFSYWLYENPLRCPGTRLIFEVFQVFVGDQQAAAEAGHFGDLGHVGCLPYVDLMTLDGQMRSYVESATRGWNPSPSKKVVSSVEDVLRRL